MKKRSALTILLTCLAGFILFSCKRDFDFRNDTAKKVNSGLNKSSLSLAPLDTTKYKVNQIIVAWKKPPTTGQRFIVRKAFSQQGIDTNSIRLRTCNSCKGSYVELWQASNIETAISGEGVTAGSTTRPKGVGEDSLASYFLNFITYSIPDTMTKPLYNVQTKKPAVFSLFKKQIVVAIIDTGVDTALINKDYLWRNPSPSSCYGLQDLNGWNFTPGSPLNNGNIQDDNLARHGTTISQFIINEFTQSPTNYVRLMVLKTLKKDGTGDLFNNICAIHYAMNNGAKIINASWGFYYQDAKFTYLDSLVTKILRKKGILFVAAAGNEMVSDDQEASRLGITALRDLNQHRFYPACLSSADNNVVTVTTATETKVSPTQNYSSLFVDLGVRPDNTQSGGTNFKFKVPYPFVVRYGRQDSISGSSFATAIATGIIGANLRETSYVPGIRKANVFTQLLEIMKVKQYETLKLKYIRGGFLSRRSVVTY